MSAPALPVASAVVRAPLACRHAGAVVGDAERRELLERVRAGQVVELELDIIAFQQKAGVQNLNFVRFRDGCMGALAKSGANTPFLKDHEAYWFDSRGGTVVSSRLDVDEDGARRVNQTVRLTARWAVEAALELNLDRFSIGWRPTGPVLCSACNTDYRKCAHWPGDQLEDGSIVEVIFTAAVLRETSAVNSPAVLETEIRAIREALSEGRARRSSNQGRRSMTIHAQLAELLGLDADDDDSIVNAVKLQVAQVQHLTAALAASDLSELFTALGLKAEAGVKGVVERVTALLSEQSAAEEKAQGQRLKEFIGEGRHQGKLVPESEFEIELGELFIRNEASAKKFLAAAPRVTPVGAPAQRGGEDTTRSSTEDDALAQQHLAACQASLPGVSAMLRQMGVKEPSKLIVKHATQ